MTVVETPTTLPTTADLTQFFFRKYGPPVCPGVGDGPARRLRYRYFTPDDVYEATVEKLLAPGGRWLDVGGGRDVFPTFPRLADRLAGVAGRLVAVDPSPNVRDNPHAHERHQALVEDFHPAEPFDLLTLRMVAEHVQQPEAVAAALARLTAPGGRVVVHTVSKWSPLSVAAWAVPFRLHNPIKKRVWGTDERDTFPVAYKMNSRRVLRQLLGGHGLREEQFVHLDDARTFGLFRKLNHAELLVLSAFRGCRLSYPERCLLGVYRKPL